MGDALSTDNGSLLMLSYGANLSPWMLRKRGVGPSASARAFVPGYTMVFQHRGGYATLDKLQDCKVPTVSTTGRGGVGETEEVGPGGYCSPRHPTRFPLSSSESDGSP